MRHNTPYTLGFAALVAFVSSIVVATTAVALRARQEQNRALDRQQKVLEVAGLVRPGERVAAAEVTARFAASIEPYVVELSTGQVAEHIDPADFDQRAAARDPATSRVAPNNSAGISRLPNFALLYHVVRDGQLDAIILPIEGAGLWATIYGYIALSPDLSSVRGITFYEHEETPGLGGEINLPAWRAKWEGRRPFDNQWTPRLEVVKGTVPPADEAPYLIDGLSGATLTGRAVTHLVQFWLGTDGFGPYLRRHRSELAP